MTSPDTAAPWPDEEQLAAFIDGRLEGAERQEVERQIAASPECAEWVAEVLALEAEGDEVAVLAGQILVLFSLVCPLSGWPARLALFRSVSFG